MTARAFRGGRCCCIAALSCLLLQLAWATAVPGSTAARTFGSSYNSAILGHQRQQQPAHDVTSGTPANLLVAVSGSESEVPESHHHHPGWARTEPRIVLQQGQQSTRSDAARTVLSQGHSITDGTSKGSSSGSSSARRQLVQLPPLRQPPQITIQELLSAADVSGDGNGSVQVKLPAVKPPENGSQSETQLPPVVVSHCCCSSSTSYRQKLIAGGMPPAAAQTQQKYQQHVVLLAEQSPPYGTRATCST